MTALLRTDGAVYFGGEPFVFTVRGWQHTPCGTHVGYEDNAIYDHVCPPKCPECKEAHPKTIDTGGERLWVCCGEPVRCPNCRAIRSLRFSDEIGGYCARCSWRTS